MAIFSASGSRNVMRAVKPSSGGAGSALLALLDVHERRLLSGQPDLDVAGRELIRDLERRLGEEIEQAQPRRRLKRLA